MEDRGTSDAFEQLTEMYLTGTNVGAESRDAGPSLRLTVTEEEIREASRSRAMRVEGVMVGHLPGFANLWLGQYAQRVARQSGPVAVVLVEDGSMEVELHAGGEVVGERWSSAEGWSLGRVMDELVGEVSVVLVRLPVEIGAEAAGYLRELDAVTLLTGSDDAAVVGGYRRLKEMVSARGEDDRVPRVRLFVCGCDSLDAERTAERLHRTAIEHLGVTPTLAGSQQKMEPVRKVRVGEYRADSPWAVMSGLMRDAEAEPMSPAETLLAGDADLSVTREDEDLQLSDLVLDEGDLLDDAELEALESFAAVFEESRERAQSQEVSEPFDEEYAAYEDEAGVIESVAEPVVEPVELPIDQPRPGAASISYTLTRYLEGVRLLSARCPSHDEVELGIDAQGCLHLLARTSAEPRDTLEQLVDSRAWAVEHAEVLRLTPNAGGLDVGREPVLHVFTDMPKALGEMAYRGKAGGRPIRLHLLMPVTVGEATTWSHVELN